LTELEGSGGGVAGKLWRKHGGGYYALLAVGTFVYLEIQSIVESFAQSEGFGDFLRSEIISTIITLGLETFVNTLMAGIWPFIWMSSMGWRSALAWAGGGYLVWSVVLAWLLARREREYRKELGL
jgi:hypothetical protein